jgi:predicted ATP-dependent protease
VPVSARTLRADELAIRCDPASLDGADAPPSPADGSDIVGQERARGALALGLAMRAPGWHVFVAGPSGSGRRSLIRRTIAAHVARDGAVRDDWVYVADFARPHAPIALRLPAGRGAALRDGMRALVDELRTTVPAVFESEEYAAEVQRLEIAFKEGSERGLQEVGEAAHEQGLVMLRTPAGFTFAPRAGDDVMTPDAFAKLDAAERERLQRSMEALQERLLHALRDELARWADLPAVLAHLQAVRAAILDDADAFRPREDGEGPQPSDALARYEVNLLVDAAAGDAGPVVEADHPTVQDLVGRVDHVAQFGMLLTDFRHVKPGTLHRANGGWLLVDALKLLQQPLAWPVLKRALLRREIRTEPMSELLGLVSTVQLEPQPIPLSIKVVLFGEREVCELLRENDPEFGELFRIVADMEDDLPRDAATQRALARTLAGQARDATLLPVAPAALARLVDHGSRLAGDATRIDAGIRRLLDVLHEADAAARAAGRDRIGAADVERAVADRRERARRVDARMRDATLRGLIAVDTSGARAGQVNGLAAWRIGDETFGHPTRITASVRLGDGQVVDIQRETQLGGPIHTKGVMILASFLSARFARLRPLAIHASLVFEQTYGPVEGDSASLAELVALMTAIADVPVRQALALTGSVDQFGGVQAVGAVDDKVEGFFDLCAARGLDGTHGAIVPESNAGLLMLRDDVVEAVRAGRFAVHAVRTVDDALELLTGMPAGEPGIARDDTVNGRIALRLREAAALRRGDPRAGAGRGGRRLRVRVIEGRE